jgi:hypothetical protein
MYGEDAAQGSLPASSLFSIFALRRRARSAMAVRCAVGTGRSAMWCGEVPSLFSVQTPPLHTAFARPAVVLAYAKHARP